MHPLLEQVRKLDLPPGDFAIYGSGPMLVRGIIEQVNDIDIICRGDAWRQAQTLGRLKYLDEYALHVVSIDNGLITFGTSWGIGDFDIDELIDSADQIRGLPFVRLQYVSDYKRIARRPKDLLHLELLENHTCDT